MISTLWDKYDKDKNGFLDKAEVTNLYHDLMTAVLADMELDAAEQAKLKENQTSLAALLLGELDTNKDDKVSREEFKAAAFLFQME